MILVDTDVLIDAGKGDVIAVNCLQKHALLSGLGISVVTQLELLVGCRNKTEQQKLDKFLKRFQILPLDSAASQTAVQLLRQYKLSHGLLIADGLIAATAISQNVPLLSKNQRDYRFIAQLQLLPYP